jgi:hypothetical protein
MGPGGSRPIALQSRGVFWLCHSFGRQFRIPFLATLAKELSHQRESIGSQMPHSISVVLVTAALAADPGPEAATYPQLAATRYFDRAGLPADFARPSPRFDFVDRSKLPAGASILSAAQSTTGHVWVVTDQGVYARKDDAYVPLRLEPRHPERGQRPAPADARIVAVAADRIGHLWAATDKGLLVSNGDKFSQFLTRGDGVPYETMTCLHLANNGDVWGGTPEGAWRLRGGDFRYFWGRRWLPGNKVRAIWTDPKGQAWLDTDGGIACIEERRMTLADKAGQFDRATQERHNRHGFISQIHLNAAGDPTRGYRFQLSDNDGLWNAIYVGAMCFRYAATGDPTVRKQAREAVSAMLELERLTGIPGYPARVIATDDELKNTTTGADLNETVRVDGEKDKIWFRSPVDAGVWCKGDTSSDEMDGHYFAWYLYHDLVADAAEKARIAAVVRRATDHIMAHDYTLVGHTGRKTRWGMWRPALINYDPYYATMRALNSLEVLTYLSIAEHITGDRKYRRAADELAQKHMYLMNTLFIRRGERGQWQGIDHSDDEMLFMMYYCYLTIEKDPDRKRIVLESISRAWEESAPDEQCVRREHSPLYNFIYGAVTGRPCDVDEARRTLQDWPIDLIEWRVRNSHRHDVTVLKAGGNAANLIQLDRVLPASERPLSRWNGNPFEADGGGDGRSEDDGAAWALAYWLGVRHGYLKKTE